MSVFLEKNLLALQKTQPRAIEILFGAPTDPSYGIAWNAEKEAVVFRKDSGGLTLLSENEKVRERAALYAEKQAEILKSGGALFFVGMRAGHEIRAVVSKLERKDWEPARAVFIYEENLDLFRLNMAAADWSEAIEAGYLYFFVGPSAARQCEEFFLEDFAKVPPDKLLPLSSQDAAQRAVGALTRVKSAIAKKVLEDKRAVDEWYEQFGAEDIARSFLSPKDMRVLLISNRFSYFIRYSIRDIRMALETLGARVVVLEEKSAVDRLNGTWLLSVLNEFRPHALIFIDHLRSEYEKIYPRGLPFFTWVQDHVKNIHGRPEPDAVVEQDFLIGYTEGLLSLGFPADQLFHLPTLTNFSVFDAKAGTPADRFRADFSFVSNISTPLENKYEDLLALYRPLGVRVRGVIEKVYAEARRLLDEGKMFDDFNAFSAYVTELAVEEGAEIPDPGSFYFQVYDHIVGPSLRHQTLEWVREIGGELALWGRGWERHPRFAQCARGVVENGPDLVNVYRGTSINLHVNHFQIEHPRILDGLAAGGFFLVRKTASSGLLDLKECCFSTQDELKNLVEHFYTHPEKRIEIVERNRRRIRDQATYETALARVFASFAARQFSKMCEDSIPRPEDLSEAGIAGLEALASESVLDPGRFFFFSAVKLLMHAGRLPADAETTLAALENYQAKWGCPVWPPRFSEKARSALDETVGAVFRKINSPYADWLAVVSENAGDGKSNSALAYRLYKSRTDWPAQVSERIIEEVTKNRSHRPLYRERTEAIGPTVAVRLLRKRAYAEAWTCVEKVIDDPKSTAWDFAEALRAGVKIGPREEIIKVFEKCEKRLSAHRGPIGNIRAELAVLRALHEVVCGNPKKVIEEGFRIDNPALLCMAHLLLGENDEAEKVIAGARGADAKTMKRLERMQRHLAAMKSGIAPDDGLLGGGLLSARGRHVLPRVREGGEGIDRLRVLNDDTLVLPALGVPGGLLFFSLKNGAIKKGDEYFRSSFPTALSNPVFDTFENRLYLADADQLCLHIISKSGVVERFAMPDACRGYIEDVAVGNDGSVAFFEPYCSKLVIGKPGGSWSETIVRDIDPNQPIRIARSRVGYLLSNANSLRLLNERGANISETKTKTGVPEICAVEDLIVCVSTESAAIEFFSEDLKPTGGAEFASPDEPFLRPVAAGAAVNVLFVLDDYRHVIYDYSIRSPEPK